VVEPDQPFGDGPPCLQTLAIDGGVPPGYQNNALLHMGVYYKRKYPMDWREKLEEGSRLHLSPPSTSEGLQSVIKSLEKKDYEYTCRTEPMRSFCNSALCRTRQHGIGDEGAYPVITDLKKLKTDPPIWFVSVNNERVEVSTKELRDYTLFCQKVADKLTVNYCAMANKDWLKVISLATLDAEEIDVDSAFGDSGVFMELLEDFLTNRMTGESIEDLFNGQPWHDAEHKKYYFRIRDFHSFLKREGMTEPRSKVFSRLRDLNAQNEMRHIKGKCLRCMWILEEKIEAAPELSTPKIPESPV
jgi:hypothetical protein